MLVKYPFSVIKAWLGKKEGRDRVCRKAPIVGDKRRSRPRRLLSKGVRIYVHWRDGAVTKTAWNASVGIPMARQVAEMYRVKAIGSEEGALTIHAINPWPLAGVNRAVLR